MIVKIIFYTIVLLSFCRCKTTSSDKLSSPVKKYIKGKIKTSSSYKPLFFSPVDTTHSELYSDSLLTAYKPDYKYRVEHAYEVENSEKEKIKMVVTFYFDSALNIIKTSPTGLNGDYGQLMGNVYWKYNNYVGNKADAGSSATLYSLDTLRQGLKYETTCDVMGNFKFDKVLSGKYLLIVNSKSTTNSPDDHLDELRYYNDELRIVFGYDIYRSNELGFNEYKQVDSMFRESLSANLRNYSSHSNSYNVYKRLREQRMDLANKLIEKMPLNIRSKFGLFSGFANKIEFSTVTVDENKSENVVIDFGITYF